MIQTDNGKVKTIISDRDFCSRVMSGGWRQYYKATQRKTIKN